MKLADEIVKEADQHLNSLEDAKKYYDSIKKDPRYEKEKKKLRFVEEWNLIAYAARQYEYIMKEN